MTRLEIIKALEALYTKEVMAKHELNMVVQKIQNLKLQLLYSLNQK